MFFKSKTSVHRLRELYLHIHLVDSRLQCKLYFLLEVTSKNFKATGLEAETERKETRRLLQKCKQGWATEDEEMWRD